jgi:Cu-Zn family superoxide dismutase
MEQTTWNGRRRPRIVHLIGLATAASLLVALPALAVSAEVTRGRFHAFAAGAGLDIGGHAVMIRTADGRTFVSVHVEGLAPDTTYGSHVHKKACGNGDADGHYQYTPGGPVNDQNEIWPGFTTNADGIGNGDARNHGTAGVTAVSVVVHAPGGAKIACADLE